MCVVVVVVGRGGGVKGRDVCVCVRVGEGEGLWGLWSMRGGRGAPNEVVNLLAALLEAYKH